MVFVAALIILIPIISWQIQQFMNDGLPVYINRIQTFSLNMILIGLDAILEVIQMNYRVILRGF